MFRRILLASAAGDADARSHTEGSCGASRTEGCCGGSRTERSRKGHSHPATERGSGKGGGRRRAILAGAHWLKPWATKAEAEEALRKIAAEKAAAEKAAAEEAARESAREAAAASPTWTGFSTGVNAGGTWSSNNAVDVSTATAFNGTPPPCVTCGPGQPGQPAQSAIFP